MNLSKFGELEELNQGSTTINVKKFCDNNLFISYIPDKSNISVTLYSREEIPLISLYKKLSNYGLIIGNLEVEPIAVRDSYSPNNNIDTFLIIDNHHISKIVDTLGLINYKSSGLNVAFIKGKCLLRNGEDCTKVQYKGKSFLVAADNGENSVIILHYPNTTMSTVLELLKDLKCQNAILLNSTETTKIIWKKSGINLFNKTEFIGNPDAYVRGAMILSEGMKGGQAICRITSSCNAFDNITNIMIKLVSYYYYTLQEYTNEFLMIENEKSPITLNLDERIKQISEKYKLEHKNALDLFSDQIMSGIGMYVSQMLSNLDTIKITAEQYLDDINEMWMFGAGHASTSILMKINRYLNVGGSKQMETLIIKLLPLELPYYNEYLPKSKNNKNYIWNHIDAPSYALFLKEAWMYCFSKKLMEYSPSFTCIANCYIISGFPIPNLKDFIKVVDNFTQTNKIGYKRWFEYLTKNPALQDEVMNLKFGCFEMAKIEGTFENIFNKGKFTMALIFEYLYTKMVAATMGRIIFTDDHFENVAYVTVTYARVYKIKCNGCEYTFYIPKGKMVQFIDLERYVFNYTPYDIFTNAAEMSVPLEDIEKWSKNVGNNEKVQNRLLWVDTFYKSNTDISDKSVITFKKLGRENFVDEIEYRSMLNILNNPFFGDNRTFAQICAMHLPDKYLNVKYLNVSEQDAETRYFYIDLDSVVPLITLDNVYEQIISG